MTKTSAQHFGLLLPKINMKKNEILDIIIDIGLIIKAKKCKYEHTDKLSNLTFGKFGNVYSVYNDDIALLEVTVEPGRELTINTYLPGKWITETERYAKVCRNLLQSTALQRKFYGK